ncbi:hypothetical protein LSUB1_G006544 [Lachnellula subtilissima]|uniref:Aminoglycoside phosphotransferase domain-containing protein n=1 Tax=Lachnellula subtilissima TaxID=602034 RepID=A0A8H8RNQ5_9HELO|nr:hypothetical protein LSUB1_G006544 [Lachnellula subtilissima]
MNQHHIINLIEAIALRYAAKHTTIPVPKVHCAFEHEHVKYIVKERIDGEEIGKGWSERPETERASLLQQLKDILTNFATFRIHGLSTFLRFGIRKEDGFFEATRDKSCLTDEERSELRKIIDMQDQLQGTHKICFTHGDASSSNVLVKKRQDAMIDFELSGFYPEYWEYTCAMHVNSQDGFWKAEIGKFLDPCPAELEIEETRRKHFGPRGLRGRYAWSHSK